MKTLINKISIFLVIASMGCNIAQNPLVKNQAIFSHYEKAIQTFALDSDKPDTLVGKEGTKIILGKNTFEFMDSTEVTGEVEIRLKEYYDNTDMLLANLSTTSNGKLIESGGMINLTAHSNGKELRMKQDKNILVEFPDVEREDMEFFYGTFENGVVNWDIDSTLDTTQTVIINITVNYRVTVNELGKEIILPMDSTMDTSVVKYANMKSKMLLGITKLGWINCDRFLDFDSLTTLKVRYAKGFQPQVYLIFKDINSIMPSFIQEGYRDFINLPVGQEANLVAFCKKKGKTYFASGQLLIGEKKAIDIELEEIPIDSLEAEIKKVVE